MVTTQALTFVGFPFNLLIFHPNISGRGYDNISDEKQNDERLHLVRIALRLNVITAQRLHYVTSVLQLRGTVCGGSEAALLKCRYGSLIVDNDTDPTHGILMI